MLHDPTGSCNSALDLMNRAVSGTLQPGMRENVAYFTSTERRCVRASDSRTFMYLLIITCGVLFK